MQVYYFTRTSESETIANDIAKQNDVKAYKIKDGKDWSGKMNFLKAGAMSAKGETIKSTFHKPSSEGDIVLVFPLWAGSFPPAVRYFVQSIDTKRVTAVVLSAASSLKKSEKDLFYKIYEVKGKNKIAPKI